MFVLSKTWMTKRGDRFLSVSLVALFLLSACAGPEVYFSPRGGTEDRIVQEIDRSQKSVDAAVYALTSQGIAEALARAQNRGVQVRVITDNLQAKGHYSKYSFLEKEGISCRVLRGKGGGYMHHKFAVFDGKTLLTGSHNWTEGAEKKNYENTLIIREKSIVLIYQNQFENLWEPSQQTESTVTQVDH